MILIGSYEVDYAAYIVSPTTWLDGAEIDLISVEDINFESAITDSTTGSSQPPSDSCTITLGEPIDEQWVRVYAIVTQEATVAVPIYTGLASKPRHIWKGPVEMWESELSGPLSRADEKLLPLGWWWQTDPATKAAALLGENCPAPVTVTQQAANMLAPIYAESGETCLTMAQKLCDSCGYRIKVDYTGRVTVEPQPTASSLSIDEGASDVMYEDLEESTDLAGAPNVYRVSAGDDVAVWRDDDPASPFSTVARGREIWAQETGVSLVEGESASLKAMRGLKSRQHAATVASYTREFVDGVYAGDLVSMDMPSTGLSGLWRITRISMQCGAGIEVDEEVERYGA